MLRLRNALILSLLLALFPTLLFSDQIYLANGDRLTGSVLKMEAGKLWVKTEVAGVVQIDWNSVSGIASQNLMVIDRKDLSDLRARNIERIGSTLAIQAEDGPHKLSINDLAAIRSRHEHDVYERTLNPKFSENWVVSSNVGLSLARGNSETTNISFGLDSTRQTLHDKLNVNSTGIYSTNNATDTTTANAVRGAARYDHEVTPYLFAYASGALEHDGLQALTLRSLASSGFGHHLIHKPQHSVDILGGLGYTRELYQTDEVRHLATGSFGQDYTWKITPATQFSENLAFDTYLNSPGDYRVAFDMGISTRFVRMFTWQTKISDRYASNPLTGFRNNDVLITTGIGLTFASRIQ